MTTKNKEPTNQTRDWPRPIPTNQTRDWPRPIDAIPTDEKTDESEWVRVYTVPSGQDVKEFLPYLTKVGIHPIPSVSEARWVLELKRSPVKEYVAVEDLSRAILDGVVDGVDVEGRATAAHMIQLLSDSIPRKIRHRFRPEDEVKE